MYKLQHSHKLATCMLSAGNTIVLALKCPACVVLLYIFMYLDNHNQCCIITFKLPFRHIPRIPVHIRVCTYSDTTELDSIATCSG